MWSACCQNVIEVVSNNDTIMTSNTRDNNGACTVLASLCNIS